MTGQLDDLVPMPGAGPDRYADQGRAALLADGPVLEFPDRSLPDLVADHATRRPDAVAVRQWSDTLTYRELGTLAGAVADALRSRGIGTETRGARPAWWSCRCHRSSGGGTCAPRTPVGHRRWSSSCTGCAARWWWTSGSGRWARW